MILFESEDTALTLLSFLCFLLGLYSDQFRYSDVGYLSEIAICEFHLFIVFLELWLQRFLHFDELIQI